MTTTTIALDTSVTMTSLVTATQTAIVQGLLDLTVTRVTTNAAETASTTSSFNGIILANKQIVNSGSTSSSTSNSSSITSTVSTIYSSSTSTTTTSTSSASSTHKLGSSLFDSSSSTGSSSNIGLVVGIPVGVIGSIILIVALYYYLRTRKRRSEESDKKLQSYYDDKYNYKMSPGNSTSPYNMKTVYQVKPNPSYNNNRQHTSSMFHGFGTTSTTYNIPSYGVSTLSLKEPQTGLANSKWNLNTPLSKWFMKHSTISEDSSRASLSTGVPFSPIIALKEFKLSNKNRSEITERSPILPKFPETSYHPSQYKSGHNQSFGSSTFGSSSSNLSGYSGKVSKQVVKADFTSNSVPKLQPIAIEKKKNLDKPLPHKPISATMTSVSMSSLEGLEKRVFERMIPTTPKVDIAKYKNDSIYRVKMAYSKNLADELSINYGEYIKILATHTDGWCLGEKVNINGVSLFAGEKYINDGRGVFPEMCLESL